MCSQKQGLKKAIATFAKGKGLDHAKHCQLGEDGAYPGGYGVAEKLVLSKVDSKPAHMPVFTHALTHTSTCTHLYSRMRHACHSTRSTNTTQCMHAHLSRTPQHMHARLTQIKAALGLDQCKFGFTGAAPITVDTLEYFGQLGIQINEVYGMSECTGATTWSTDEAHVWGSCGWPMPGNEVRICKPVEGKPGEFVDCPKAEDIFNPTEEVQGEICFRGRHIMLGYMANPDLGEEHVAEIQKKNQEAIDSEGWLHSGDKVQTANGIVIVCEDSPNPQH